MALQSINNEGVCLPIPDETRAVAFSLLGVLGLIFGKLFPGCCNSQHDAPRAMRHHFGERATFFC
jgi:hypothetical protein